MRSSRLVRAAVALCATSSLLLFMPAQANADPDAGACTPVSGGVAIAPGLGIVPQFQSFNFNSIIISCVGVPPGSDEAGNYTVTAAGKSVIPETCVLGAGWGRFTGGAMPEGAVTGGQFYYVRVGVLVLAAGGITTPTDPNDFKLPPIFDNHDFAAALVFTPNAGQNCGLKPDVVTGATLSGAAVIADGAWPEGLTPNPCPLPGDPGVLCK